MSFSWCGWALIIWSAVLVACCAPDTGRLVAEIGGPSFDEALLAAGTLLALAIAGWVLVVAALVVVGASSELIGLITPSLLRRALLAGTVGALALGPAHAEQAVRPDAGAHHSVSGLPLPDRPDASSARHVTAHAASPAGTRTITVRTGGTLWGIAARSLPDRADVAQVAAAVRAWHDANRDVIGEDPDLIVPGQRLASPTGKDLP